MAVVLRFGGQRLRFGGDNLMWSGHIPHFHTKLIIERALQVGAQLPSKLIEFDLYVRDMYPIWMEYHDLYHRYRGDGDPLFKCINLANPDWPLATPYGGLNWADEGVLGNGVNGYIDTNFNPSLLVSGQKFQLNDASRGAIVHDDSVAVANLNSIDGISSSTDTNTFWNSSTVNHRINSGSTTMNAEVDNTGIGLKVLNRINSNDVNVIIKSDFYNRTQQSSTSIRNANQHVLRIAWFHSVKGLSSYFMGKAIPYSISQEIRAIENADMARLGLPQIA